MRVGRPIKSYVRITQRFTPTSHYGVDFSAYVGTPVYAATDGIAYGLNQPDGFGRYVRIETAASKVYAAHLDTITIGSGQPVKRGQLIGYSGNTGNSTGPHLHFEIRRNAGSPFRHGAIDPWPLIDWDASRQGARAIGLHLGNDCPLSDADRRVIQALRPGNITFLPNYSGSRQPIRSEDIAWVLSVVPDCHVIVRPYVAPAQAATDQGCYEYVSAVIDMLAEWMAVVPIKQLHLQLWNEPNMPRGSAGWEGFGTQDADMSRFDRVFCEAYARIKGRYPSVKIGWTPLTIGNRDVWFTNDTPGRYYLHGSAGCRETWTMTSGDWDSARRNGPCYQSLSLADELYAHVYVHVRENVPNAWSHPAYGLRFERMRYWWPEKTLWINEYGVPGRYQIDQVGGTAAVLQGATYLSQRTPFVEGASLWILGDNPRWGGEIYHRGGHPIPLVYDLAKLNGVSEPPPMSEAEIGEYLSGLVQEHILPLNPEAALFRAAKLRNPYLTPASDECRPHELLPELPKGLPDDLICQAFRDPRDDGWQDIAWTRIGQWSAEQIRWLRRRN